MDVSGLDAGAQTRAEQGLQQQDAEQARALLALLDPEEGFALDGQHARLADAQRAELARFLQFDLLPAARVAGLSGGGAAPADRHPRQRERWLCSMLQEFVQRGLPGRGQGALLPAASGAAATTDSDVALTWLDQDAHHVGSSEQPGHYRFGAGEGRRVCFEILADAGQAGARPGRDHRLWLHPRRSPALDGCTLWVYFHHAVDPEGRRQKALDRDTEARLLAQLPEAWRAALGARDAAAGRGRASVLSRQLARFTARRQLDHFVQRDLAGALRTSLRAFIEGRLLGEHLLDPRLDPEALQERVRSAQLLSEVAARLIDFLAGQQQLQRSLWRRPRLVQRSFWCVSLDRIDPTLYPDIAECETQRARWVELFAIDRVDEGGPAYSVPLSVDFLAAHPALLVDTRLLPGRLAEQVVAGLGSAPPDGLMFRGDNLDALRLLQPDLKGTLPLIYIDPPYNAPATDIVYQNAFRHSSWLSLMADRLRTARSLLHEGGSLVVAIDENERARLELLCAQLFPDRERHLVAVEHNPRGIQGAGFSYTNDFALFLLPPGKKLPLRPLSRSKAKPLMKTGSVSRREEGPYMFYGIETDGERITAIGEPPPADFHPGAPNTPGENGRTWLWPVDSSGGERKWRYKPTSLERVRAQIEIRRSGAHWVPYLHKHSESYRTLWTGARHNAAEHGSNLLKHMGLRGFDFPKSLHTVMDCLRVGLDAPEPGVDQASADADPAPPVLDFFGGSGTTAHGVIALNRQDGGRRRFVLVERGAHFETVTLGRVLKAAYSEGWKHGLPDQREGCSLALQCLQLESHTDLLARLRWPDAAQAQRPPTPADDPRARPSLRYLPRGNSGQPPLREAILELSPSCDPFALAMMQPPTELPPVDLLETALRWLGLREARRHVSVHLQARFGADAAGRLPVEQHGLCDAAQGWRFRMAEGSLPEGGQVLLLLRECHGDAAQDALMLATFLEHHAGVDMSRFARLYVNGVVDGVQVALAGAAVSLRSLEGLLADPSLVQAGI